MKYTKIIIKTAATEACAVAMKASKNKITHWLNEAIKEEKVANIFQAIKVTGRNYKYQNKKSYMLQIMSVYYIVL